MPKINEIVAVILCGGKGSRLKSITGDNQKVMAEFEGEPFLNLILKYLKEQGIRNIVLCAGFKADILESYYKVNNQGLDIKFSKETEPLGTGGALKNSISKINSDTCFVLNGDSLCKVDLNGLLDFHIKNKAKATIAVSKVDDAGDYGSISLDGENRIIAFEEKRSKDSRYVNAGVYCIGKQAFDLMPDENKFSIELDYFPRVIDQGFYGFITDKKFYDIGTPERFEKAQKEL